jgi:hypothetical protein
MFDRRLKLINAKVNIKAGSKFEKNDGSGLTPRNVWLLGPEWR